MLKFGNLEIVTRTFTREGGATREQAYNGVKFRRYESKIGKKAAELEGKAVDTVTKEEFVISNALFELFNLEENALVQAKFGNTVYFLVVEDQDVIEPKANIMRRSIAKDGTKLEKGKKFNNDFLTENLVSVGILNAEQFGNQFLAVADVTAETEELPSVVKAVYSISIDTTVDASKEQEEEVSADKF